jgi:hypothetical protein
VLAGDAKVTGQAADGVGRKAAGESRCGCDGSDEKLVGQADARIGFCTPPNEGLSELVNGTLVSHAARCGEAMRDVQGVAAAGCATVMSSRSGKEVSAVEWPMRFDWVTHRPSAPRGWNPVKW